MIVIHFHVQLELLSPPSPLLLPDKIIFSLLVAGSCPLSLFSLLICL